MRVSFTQVCLAAAFAAVPNLFAQETDSARTLQGAAVTLPWTEVKRLMDQARAAEKREEERAMEVVPPAEEVIESARYKAVVGRSATELEARFEIDLLMDTWHMVPLLGVGPSIVSATLDGKTARLRLEKDWYCFVAQGLGPRTVVVRFVLPRGTEAGDSNIDLKVAASPRNHLELQIPRRAITVAVEPYGALKHSEADGSTRVSADFPQTEHLRINWSGALPEQELQKAKILRRCAVSQLVSVGGGLIRLDARLAFSILQGKIERFDIQLPGDTTLLDVAGAEVREHRVVKHDGGSAVAVSLMRPVTGDFVVRVQAERTLDATSTVAAVPELRILDVDREWGHIGVNATTNIEIAPTGTKGLTVIDVKELPAEVWQVAQHPILLSYKYLSHPYELLLDVRRHEDLAVLESTIDSATVTTFQTSDGKLLHSAVFQTKNTHKQFMKVTLPKGTNVLAAFVSDLPVKPATNEAGEILVPLEKSTPGQSDQRPFPVELLYLEERSTMGLFGRSDLKFLKVDVPISVFRWTLYLPRQFTYWGFSGNLEKGAGWDSAPRGGDPAARQAAERLESQGAGKSAGAVGLLPVRINLPTTGLRYAFQSELVMVKDKPPEIAFRFVGAVVTKTLRVLIGLAAVLAALRAAFVLISARRGIDVTAPLRRMSWLVGTVIAAVGLETWVFGASVPSIAATIIAAIVCADTYVSMRADSQPAA